MYRFHSNNSTSLLTARFFSFFIADIFCGTFFPLIPTAVLSFSRVGVTSNKHKNIVLHFTRRMANDDIVKL